MGDTPDIYISFPLRSRCRRDTEGRRGLGQPTQSSAPSSSRHSRGAAAASGLDLSPTVNTKTERRTVTAQAVAFAVGKLAGGTARDYAPTDFKREAHRVGAFFGCPIKGNLLHSRSIRWALPTATDKLPHTNIIFYFSFCVICGKVTERGGGNEGAQGER